MIDKLDDGSMCDPTTTGLEALARVVDWAEYTVDPQKRVHVKLQLLGGSVLEFSAEPQIAHDMGSKLIRTSALAQKARQEG